MDSLGDPQSAAWQLRRSAWIETANAGRQGYQSPPEVWGSFNAINDNYLDDDATHAFGLTREAGCDRGARGAATAKASQIERGAIQ